MSEKNVNKANKIVMFSSNIVNVNPNDIPNAIRKTKTTGRSSVNAIRVHFL